MKKVSDLMDALEAVQQTNGTARNYKICIHRISNLKNYIEQHCVGCSNAKLVIINSLDATQAAIPDWMLITEFFQSNIHMYGNISLSNLSSCYNLDKNLVIRKPSITLENLIQCNSPSLAGQFHDTLFVGKRNAFLGIILYNGAILLYRETLLKLLDYEKEFFDVMNLIMNRIQLINSIIYGGAVKGVDEFIKQLSVSNIYMEHKDHIIKTIVKSANNLQDISVRQLFDLFENNIYSYYINPLIKSSIFGATNLYSYSNLLKSMRSNFEEKLFRATQDGYNAGLARSFVFLQRGYTPKLIDGGVHWTKDVKIYPEIAIIKNVSFKIPEKSYDGKLDRKDIYYITQLTIHPDGSVNAIGRHPNVASSGQVCLGDLKDRSYNMRSMTNDDLADYVDRVETLLENVNFDSSYFGYDRDFTLDQFGDPASGMSRFKARQKLKSAEIRQALFVADDGIEDEMDEEASSSTAADDFDPETVRAQFQDAEMEVTVNAGAN